LSLTTQTLQNPPRNTPISDEKTGYMTPIWWKFVSLIASLMPGVNTYSKSLTLTQVDAGDIDEQTFTITGLKTNEAVFVNAPALTDELGLVGFRISAADTIALMLYNNSAGNITEGAATFKIVTITL